MNFKIENLVFEKFPGLSIGLVVAKGIDNQGTDEDVLKMLREKENEIREQFEKGTLSENPKINAWRKAYSSFGAKPKKYKCSVENLYRMILDGIELRHINKVVDIYNYISIKHIVPVGGDNLDKIDGNIVLKFAEGNESFRELNCEDITNPKEGEVVYSDDKEILCRRWNWRECNKSKMTEDTKNISLVVEGMAPVTKEEVEIITQELAELIQKYCGGDIKTFVLDNNTKEIGV